MADDVTEQDYSDFLNIESAAKKPWRGIAAVASLRRRIQRDLRESIAIDLDKAGVSKDIIKLVKR